MASSPMAALAAVIMLALLAALLPPASALDLMTTAYDIAWKVNPSKGTMEGSATISLRNDGKESVSSVTLLLNRLLKVSAVEAEDGDAQFKQHVANDPSVDWASYPVNHVDVPFTAPLKPGQTTRLTLDYAGGLASGGEAIRYAKDQICEELTILRMETYPYPYVAGSNPITQSRFSYRLAINVPDGYVVANGGIQGKTKRKDGWVTYRYSMPAPRWRLDVTIGKFDIFGSRSDGVVIYCLPKYRQGAEHLLSATKDVTALFNGWWGPLKKESSLALLQIPDGYGSQADWPAVILTADAFVDSNRAIGLSHEMAHFYNPAGDKDPARWMSEGFATFVQLLVESHLLRTKLPDLMESMRQEALAMSEKIPDMTKRPLDEYQHLGNTTPAYQVGSLAFHQLYLILGEQTFHKAIAELYNTHGVKPCDGKEWLKTVERASGRPLDKWADDWVFTNGCWESIKSDRRLDEIAGRYSN